MNVNLANARSADPFNLSERPSGRPAQRRPRNAAQVTPRKISKLHGKAFHCRNQNMEQSMEGVTNGLAGDASPAPHKEVTMADAPAESAAVSHNHGNFQPIGAQAKLFCSPLCLKHQQTALYLAEHPPRLRPRERRRRIQSPALCRRKRHHTATLPDDISTRRSRVYCSRV